MTSTQAPRRRAARLPRHAGRPRRRPALEHLPALAARASRSPRCSSLFGLARLQDQLPLDIGMAPDGPGRRLERRRLVRDEHQLAVVLRRGGRGPPAADGRVRGAELPVGGGRHRRGRGAGPRVRPVRAPTAASATSGPTSCAPRCGSCCRSRSSRRSCWSPRGVIQNLHAHTEITTLAGGTQSVLGGPVASQEAIKELGTNGGGFFNANSAHPFENPTPWTNALEVLAPAAHPVQPAAHVRPDGRRPPAGLGDPRRDGDAAGSPPSAC